MESQHSPDSNNIPQSHNISHKRTHSTEKTVDDDPSANDSESSANDLPPPKKKKKSESQSESPNTPDTKLTADDGDDLIPLRSQGPNIFYGYSDALFDLFRNGGMGDVYGPTVGLYWLKSVVVDRYEASGDQDEWDDGLAYAGIVCSSKNRQIPEAKLLSTHFDGHSDDWWFEVTLKRQKPEGMGMLVRLESSEFYPDGDIYGGEDLGEWWISDIQAAEGESKKAIVKVHATMF